MAFYAVGDIQGCCDALDRLLCEIRFDPDVDHLLLVGDLVNRGPESLRTLRRVRALGRAATAVLGNHDLHLLAAWLGVRPLSSADTLAEVLGAPDAADLIVIGSGPEATPGRTGLDRAGEKLVEGARCPVAVAPRGLAGRDDYELRRIDVGIDGSREAAAALTVAAHLARAHDARLRLVAVAELGFDLGGAPRPPDPREVERLGRHLDNAGDGLPGIWVEAYLREGSADQILIGLSREADLLVLGSQAAYGDGGHVSLGEAATRILRAAACPTLVVPAP